MHPATLYGFVLSAIALVGVIVLVALGDVRSDIGVPLITTLAGVGVGVAGGIATPRAQVSQVPTSGVTEMAETDA